MIARKLLWIVEICWGTTSNFRTCKVRHSTSSSLFSLSLYFLFSLTVVPLMILLSWFKFVNVLHIYLFISNDWKGLYKKKLFNWIIERIKLCDCVFSIFAMPPVHENFQMWSYHHHYCHHHFLWSILIMVFGGFWGIYIDNFLLGRFKKNEAQSPVIVTDLWFLMIVWILNFVCKWWWVLLSPHMIYELCIIVWIDKILLTYDWCMWNSGIYWCMNWYHVFLCYSSQYIYNIA